MNLLLNIKTTQNVLSEAWPGWKMGFTTSQGNKLRLLGAVSGFVMTLSRGKAQDAQWKARDAQFFTSGINILCSTPFARFTSFKGHKEVDTRTWPHSNKASKVGWSTFCIKGMWITGVCPWGAVTNIFIQLCRPRLFMSSHQVHSTAPGARGSGGSSPLWREAELLEALLIQYS